MKKLLLVCVCAAAAVLCGCMSKTEIAERYLQQGEFEKALFVCEDVKQSDDPAFYAAYAQALWRLGRIKEADAALDQALKLGIKKGWSHILRAQIRMAECNYAGAAKEAAEAVKLMPESLLAKQMYSNALKRDAMIKKAYAALQKAPENDLNVSRLAKLMYYNMNRGNEAVALLKNFCGKNKDCTLSRDTLAWILATSANAKLRSAKTALQLAEINLKKAPAHPVWLDTMAAASAACGDYKNAQKYLAASRANWEKLSVKRKNFYPHLERDSNTRFKLYESGKNRYERPNSVRMVWLIGD